MNCLVDKKAGKFCRVTERICSWKQERTYYVSSIRHFLYSTIYYWYQKMATNFLSYQGKWRPSLNMSLCMHYACTHTIYKFHGDSDIAANICHLHHKRSLKWLYSTLINYAETGTKVSCTFRLLLVLLNCTSHVPAGLARCWYNDRNSVVAKLQSNMDRLSRWLWQHARSEKSLNNNYL